MRRRWGAALVIAAALGLTGCSSAGVDASLTAAVADAVSAGASAQLGLELSEDDRILSGTLTTLLGDMAEALADTERDLALFQATDAEDAAYRDDALSGVRASIEAIHLAENGDEDAGLDELTASVDDLRELEADG
jgi:hypothetical protein